MTAKKFVRTNLNDKVIGASHGYQDDGPRPTAPFFSGQLWLGAHFWALSVFLKGFLIFFCAGHLWLGARLLGSLVYFFVLEFLFSFLFSFFSVSASWIPPLGYENILNYSIES